MDDIFLKNLPCIDLHGYDTETAMVATEDFISDNLTLKNSKLLIIHGKGKGLVKKSVHEVLKRNHYVKEYHIDNQNDGCTIVWLIWV